MTRDNKTLTVCGDKLEIEWNGNVWVSPINGQQHSSARDAMRTELEKYMLSCGKDIDSDEMVEKIDGLLDTMK